MPLLSAEFSKSVEARFFQPLTGDTRNLSIDLLARLADSFEHGRRSMVRSEAVDVLRSALAEHLALLASLPAGESRTQWSDPSYRANRHLAQFIEAGWMREDEFRHNLHKRTVALDSNARALLALLREISGASTDASSRFTDTFRSVIDAILSPVQPAFGAAGEKPYGALRDMIDRCAKGTRVLQRIENLLRRFTREQAETLSRRRNLELVIVELQDLTRTQYYRELNNPLLFQRGDEAAALLEEITYEGESLQRMAGECLEREEAGDLASAQLQVIDLLDGLAGTLRGLRNEAQQIERWASRFLSASLAKFRYLQSVPSRQLEMALAQVSGVADQLAGRKWWKALPSEQLALPRLPELGLLWGTGSLWPAPQTAEEQAPAPVRRSPRAPDEAALRHLREVRRKSITPGRACAFVERTLKSPGDRIRSAQLTIRDNDALLDVLSCLCYAHTARINFRVHPDNGTDAASRYAPAGDWYLENFVLERTR